MRPQIRRQLLAAFALLLPALGCSDGPTSPDGQPIVFQGTVRFGETGADGWRSLVITDDGLARFEVTELRPTLIDAAFVPLVSLGFGLGRPLDGDCNTTFRASAVEGDFFVLGLTAGEHCVTFFDPGALPEDGSMAYTMVVDFDE